MKKLLSILFLISIFTFVVPNHAISQDCEEYKECKYGDKNYALGGMFSPNYMFCEIQYLSDNDEYELKRNKRIPSSLKEGKEIYLWTECRSWGGIFFTRMNRTQVEILEINDYSVVVKQIESDKFEGYMYGNNFFAVFNEDILFNNRHERRAKKEKEKEEEWKKKNEWK